MAINATAIERLDLPLIAEALREFSLARAASESDDEYLRGRAALHQAFEIETAIGMGDGAAS